MSWTYLCGGGHNRLRDNHDRIAEVHVRHRSYTCFAFKVVRA